MIQMHLPDLLRNSFNPLVELIMMPGNTGRIVICLVYQSGYLETVSDCQSLIENRRITLFTYISQKIFNSEFLPGISWRHIIGVSFLGGIGFTMSLFISGLSFANPQYLEYSRLGIIGGSIICGIVGFATLF